MNKNVMAGFMDELTKDASVARKILTAGTLLGAGVIGAGELAARGGHEEKLRYRKRLKGRRTRSHLYADPATHG